MSVMWLSRQSGKCSMTFFTLGLVRLEKPTTAGLILKVSNWKYPTPSPQASLQSYSSITHELHHTNTNSCWRAGRCVWAAILLRFTNAELFFFCLINQTELNNYVKFHSHINRIASCSFPSKHTDPCGRHTCSVTVLSIFLIWNKNLVPEHWCS